MAEGSAPNTEEPKSLDESKEEENAKASSSFPDEEEHEEYLEVDPNDMEEVDLDDLEGVDFDDLYEVVDEEYEKDTAEGPSGEDESDSEKPELEPEGESPKEEKKKWKSLLSSSSDEEEEDSETSDDSEWDDSDENQKDSGENEEDSGENEEDSGWGGSQLSEADLEDDATVLKAVMGKKMRDKDGNRYTLEEWEERLVNEPDKFDFPVDPEEWREEDLREYWADAPVEMTKPGWDPVWADKEDWEVVRNMEEDGEDPPIAPFYVPYRRPYPVIPDNHRDIDSPKSVIEELDRIEEFLKWVSYIFPDGSS